MIFHSFTPHCCWNLSDEICIVWQAKGDSCSLTEVECILDEAGGKLTGAPFLQAKKKLQILGIPIKTRHLPHPIDLGASKKSHIFLGGYIEMGVSKNWGIPKWMVYNRRAY